MVLKEFFQGIRAYAKANRVISKHKLWPYVIIPGVMSLCYVFMLIVMGMVYFQDISGHVNEHWIPNFMQGETMMVVTTILLWTLMLLVGYMTYKHVILIFTSPILGYLSELTEMAVYDQPAPDFDFKNFVRDLVRGVIINVRNLILTIILTLMAWTLVFIPIVGVMISTSLMLLIQLFYNGFGLMDYTLERKRYSVRESVRFVHNNRPRVIGVGMGFMLLITIPLVGWFAAPAYGTVAATLAALEKINGDDPRLGGL